MPTLPVPALPVPSPADRSRERITSLLLALAALSLGAGSAAAADIAAGQNIAAGQEIAAKGSPKGTAACSSCHGANGEGQATAGIPRLAGLDAGYLQAQLAAFGSGTRDNAIMSPIAKTMDPTSMADTSAYYAGLAVPAASAPGKPSPDVAKGEALALHGDWSASIPPCAACHGKQGHGVGAAFPAIAGQSAAYIVSQLQAWKTGSRHDDPLALMRTVASRMNDAQVAAVAAYYATLPAASIKTGQDTREGQATRKGEETKR